MKTFLSCQITYKQNLKLKILQNHLRDVLVQLAKQKTCTDVTQHFTPTV